MNSDTWCPVPWVGCVSISPNGGVAHCSASYDRYTTLKESPSIGDLINHPTMVDIRRTMLRGQWHDACAGCKRQESAQVSNSYRQNKLHEFDYSEYDTSSEILPNPVIATIDIRWSNLCNMKCVTCYSGASTSIQAERVDRGLEPKPLSKVIRVDNDTTDVTQLVKDNIGTLRRIYMAGGEPLLMPEHHHLINWLIDNNHTDLTLNYSTNGSVVQLRGTDIEDYWRKFNNVIISLSIDAIGKRAEFIRAGTDWNKMVPNIQRFIEMERSGTISQLRIQCTVSGLALLSLGETIWWLTHYMSISPSNIDLILCTSPHQHNPNILPPKLLESALSALIEIANIKPECKPLIMGLVHQLSPNYNERVWTDFITELRDQSEYRNQLIQNHIPELEPYL